MAGHSKWANIKHRKGRQDAARGKLFAKLIRAIEAAARRDVAEPVRHHGHQKGVGVHAQAWRCSQRRVPGPIGARRTRVAP